MVVPHDLRNQPLTSLLTCSRQQMPTWVVGHDVRVWVLVLPELGLSLIYLFVLPIQYLPARSGPGYPEEGVKGHQLKSSIKDVDAYHVSVLLELCS